MSMLGFFNQGFKAAKCKTLLKLTIPRIKLLRNRREVQIKQMRRDIAKLLETGQEATARIRVEHIIREENMMAAQEILELFCELITVRLPIIEAQRECPLDLKEAISSICFAAPRCADLPELLQVQIAFGMKYGKEFVDAAAELRPDCGVNRQLIELLSIRAPSPEKKLKLLKEIAEEHEVDWDPSASETEFLKPREDLLNGPSQFMSGSKLPLPEEKPDDTLNSTSGHAHDEQPESDADFDQLDLPEVPKVALRPSGNAALAPDVASTMSHTPNPGNHGPAIHPAFSEHPSQESHLEREVLKAKTGAMEDEMPTIIEAQKEEKQFVPFITPLSQSSIQYSSPKPTNLSAPTSRTDRDSNLNLDDVLAAAQAAAETAERAASAARSAATLAQARISELTKKSGDKSPEASNENPFHMVTPNHQLEDLGLRHQQSFGGLSNDSDQSDPKPYFDHQHSFADSNKSLKFDHDHEASGLPDLSSFNKLRLESDPPHTDQVPDKGSASHQPQRLPSMDDDYYSYPNLFSSQKSGVGSSVWSGKDDTDKSP